MTRSLRKAAGRFMAGVGKHFATLAIALVAILISVATWQHYVTAPWTRNGSVRVQVANVAPQISGKIVELRVADNQFVHKGECSTSSIPSTSTRRSLGKALRRTSGRPIWR